MGREVSDTRRASTLPGDLVEHAAGAPQVHFVGVEAVGEETLRGAVPAGGDVLRVGLLGVDAPAGSEVPQLQDVLLQGQMTSHQAAVTVETISNIYVPMGKLRASKAAYEIQMTSRARTRASNRSQSGVSIQWDAFTNILALFHKYFQMSIDFEKF